MKIDKSEISNYTVEIAQLLERIYLVDKVILQPKIIDRKSLLSEEKEINWNEVKTVFKKDFRLYDKLLYRLHFKRKATLTDKQLYQVVEFLVIGFILSKDIRYFNEFLFFYEKNKKK